MITKLLTKIIVPLFIILLLFGCKEQKARIGLCMDSYVQERWVKDRDYFVERAKELGAEVLVEAAQGNSQKQIEQAKKFLEEGIKSLVVVAVDAEAAASIVETAHKFNAKVIAYDRLIKNCNLDYYISFDNIKVGELQAEYLTKRKPTGKYAIICGPTSDNNSFLLKLGYYNILQPLIEKGDIIKVYDSFVDEWTSDEGSKHMEKCLLENKKEIDAVLVANDALASGVISTLKKYDLAGKVLVTGQDADLEACKNILGGFQTMTVYKPIKAIAVTAAETAVKIANNEAVTSTNSRMNNGKVMVPSILLTSMIVNKDNIKMTVVGDSYQGEQDIYK